MEFHIQKYQNLSCIFNLHASIATQRKTRIEKLKSKEVVPMTESKL